MEKYEKRECIGQGGIGMVNKYAVLNKSDSFVAVKSIIFHNAAHKKLVEREISVLQALKHDNIVRLLEVVDSEKGFNLVFELLDIDLAKFIHTRQYRSNISCSRLNPMTEAQVDAHIVKIFLYQILQGLKYCHSQKVMHRDLKPANLLINLESLTIKLADFGLARKFDTPPYSPNMVTLSYRPPELLCHLGSDMYSTAVDIWSVGCILVEMVTASRLFPGNSEATLLFDKIYWLFHTEDWPDKTSLRENASLLDTLASQENMELAGLVPDIGFLALDLLSKMLTVNPRNRITADDALKHDYFNNVHSFQLEYKKSN